MIIDVLALGESILQYDNADNIRIGVNDTNRQIKCHHLVVLNCINSFIPERRKYIKGTSSHVHTIESLYNDIIKACDLVTYYKMEYVLNDNASPKPLDIDNKLYHSRTSPFVATMLAYKMGAKTIRFFGVDLKTHYAYSNGNLGIIEARCWQQLFKELIKKNITLIIPKHSKLFQICQDIKQQVQKS